MSTIEKGDSSSEDSEQEVILKETKGPEEESGEGNPAKPVELKKELSLFSTVSLVVGRIIGSGIFITPSRVLRYSGSFGLALILWTMGGLLSVGGGLCYVELGNMIRSSGAEYAYLKEAYTFRKKKPASVVFGNLLGFLFSWSYAFFIMPSSNAVIVLACGRYFAQAVAGGDTPPDAAVKLCAIAAITFITLLNVYSLRATAVFVNVTAVIKVLALLFVTGLGVWQLVKGEHSRNFTSSFEDTSTCVGDITLAFYSVTFSYDGWNGIGYTVEENKNSKRNLLLGILLGVPSVTVCYILVNVAYFAGLSKADILSSPATALTLAHSSIGDAGLVLIPLMVAVSTIGSATAGVFSGSRLAYTTARDGNLMNVFGLIHNKFRTPIMAVIAQGALTAILLLAVGNIGQLIDGTSIILSLFYALVFAGILIMRFTRKEVERPFKVLFLIPIAMLLTFAFLVIVPVIFASEERLYLLALILLVLFGIPVYFGLVWGRWRPKFLNKITDKLDKVFMIGMDSSLPTLTINEIDLNEMATFKTVQEIELVNES